MKPSDAPKPPKHRRRLSHVITAVTCLQIVPSTIRKCHALLVCWIRFPGIQREPGSLRCWMNPRHLVPGRPNETRNRDGWAVMWIHFSSCTLTGWQCYSTRSESTHGSEVVQTAFSSSSQLKLLWTSLCCMHCLGSAGVTSAMQFESVFVTSPPPRKEAWVSQGYCARHCEHRT